MLCLSHSIGTGRTEPWERGWLLRRQFEGKPEVGSQNVTVFSDYSSRSTSYLNTRNGFFHIKQQKWLVVQETTYMLRDQRRTTPSASQDAIHGPVSSNDKVAWGWNTIDPTRSLWPVTIGTKDPDLNLTCTLFLFVQTQWFCYLTHKNPLRRKMICGMRPTGRKDRTEDVFWQNILFVWFPWLFLWLSLNNVYFF